jgi:hypothetical protein
MPDTTFSIASTSYRWAGLSTFPEGSFWHRRSQSFLEYINWDALCHYASGLNDGKEATIESAIALGGCHMVPDR